MTRWTFPPANPTPRPCDAHKVWGDCGICRMVETVAAARLASWRRG